LTTVDLTRAPSLNRHDGALCGRMSGRYVSWPRHTLLRRLEKIMPNKYATLI